MCDAPEVRDNPAEHRYEVRAGDEVAFLQYHDRPDGHRVLVHTEVPPALEGKGIGGRLVKAALDEARAGQRRVVAVCPFVRSSRARHPEYADLEN